MLNKKRIISKNENESSQLKDNKLSKFLKNSDKIGNFKIEYTNHNENNEIKVENQIDDESSNSDLTQKIKGKQFLKNIENSNKKRIILKEKEDEEILVTKSKSQSKSKGESQGKLIEKEKTLDEIKNFENNSDFISFPLSTRFLTKDQSSYLLSSSNEKIIPWMNEKIRTERGHLKLHYEIKSFYNFIKPTKEEMKLRKNSVKEIKIIIKSHFPEWTVKSFGSFNTNLDLPDSDIDIIILQDEKNGVLTNEKMLEKIKRVLIEENSVNYVQIIKSRVPIIKANLKSTNVNIDISVNRKNGYQTQKDINLILNHTPCIREIIYVLKYYLRQKKANEAFTGGISSFLLFNLVYAFISYYIKSTTLELKYITLSHLLIGFFNFYGVEMNYYEIGISIRNGGFFFKRNDKNYEKLQGNQGNSNSQGYDKYGKDQVRMLCVENYQDLTQDIGRSCFKYPQIVVLFSNARDALYFPDEIVDSYLEKIINIDSFLIERYNSKVNKKHNNSQSRSNESD
jgi:DNA polymerase sigma